MRKFILFKDGCKKELSPLTFSEFDKYDQWFGGNDLAFNHFLRLNNFKEIEDFAWHDAKYDKEAACYGAKIVFEPGEPQIDWSVLYGDTEGDWELKDGEWVEKK